MDKKEVINLLSKKLNGDLKISYNHLGVLTNYSKRQLIRLSKSLNEKGIDSTLKHGNKGLAAHNRASNDEIDLIVNFKKLYPNITIAQFRDIYLEDIIFNSSRKKIYPNTILNLEVFHSFKDSIKNINGLLPLNTEVIKEILLYIF